MNAVVIGALVVVSLGIALCLVRLVRGPSLFDRIIALDCIGFNIAGGILLYSIYLRSGAFMDSVLVLALLLAVAPVALSAYLEGTLVD